MVEIEASEVVIPTSFGGIYAKKWTNPFAAEQRRGPIVLLHDSLGCVALWRDFPERLASAVGRTVIAYDRIGFGKSSPHPGKLDLTFIKEEATSTFAAVLDYFSLDHFVAFGHSVGGGMAVEVAAQFPAKCEALVTEAAQAFVEQRTITGIKQAREHFARPEQLERLRKYHADKAKWVLDAWVDTWLALEFQNWSLDRAAAEVVCPLLSIHGEQDEFGSTAHPTRIASKARGASTVEILPDCGHVPHKENHGAVIDLVGKFLQAR